MKISGAIVANWLAWGLFVILFAVAVVVVDRLGFLGLLLLGAATWFVCVRAGMNEDRPIYGTTLVRQTGIERPSSPEQREAHAAERQASLVPLRFFARCGMVLTAIGAAGFAWQYWSALPPS